MLICFNEKICHGRVVHCRPPSMIHAQIALAFGHLDLFQPVTTWFTFSFVETREQLGTVTTGYRSRYGPHVYCGIE